MLAGIVLVLVFAAALPAIGAAWYLAVRRTMPTYLDAFAMGGTILFLAVLALVAGGAVFMLIFR